MWQIILISLVLSFGMAGIGIPVLWTWPILLAFSLRSYLIALILTGSLLAISINASGFIIVGVLAWIWVYRRLSEPLSVSGKLFWIRISGLVLGVVSITILEEPHGLEQIPWLWLGLRVGLTIVVVGSALKLFHWWWQPYETSGKVSLQGYGFKKS